MRVGRAIALALARRGRRRGGALQRVGRPAAERPRPRIRALGSPGRRRSPRTSPTPRRAGAWCARPSRELGGLDLLVHSAANFHRAAARGHRRDRLGRGHGPRTPAPGCCSRAKPRAMLRERRGRIVLISDLLAVQPVRGYLAHCRLQGRRRGARPRARRGARAGGLRQRRGARERCSCPKGPPEAGRARWARQAPLKRNGDPSDVAAPVLFFCAGPAFVTGQILRVDGGKSLT